VPASPNGLTGTYNLVVTGSVTAIPNLASRGLVVSLAADGTTAANSTQNATVVQNQQGSVTATWLFQLDASLPHSVALRACVSSSGGQMMVGAGNATLTGIATAASP
jgi:hypothetical protein